VDDGDSGYYTEKLSAERLRHCYEIAPPETRAYLEGEIAHVLARAPARGVLLELGCGYGRVLARLTGRARTVAGIDTSLASLRLVLSSGLGSAPIRLAAMNGARLGFPDGVFDMTICIQNGISAFHIDPTSLVAEAVRVSRRGAPVLFSSYAERFWEGRLAWFRAQAEAGLLGQIDEEATGNGVIVCRDGFRATTCSADDFREIGRRLGLRSTITEVDGSSLFCEYIAP